jgi:DNA-binding NarL/FixJ family response regulator
MNLILCCGNPSLLQRWYSALHELFTTYQAPTLQDMRILVDQRIGFDLLLVHGSQVDREIVTYIRARRPACRLFILSDRPDDEEGLTYLRLGVVGYANSYISEDRLREAVRAIAGGSVWINQQLMQRLIATAVPQKSGEPDTGEQGNQPQALEQLSKRELQIAQLVAEGLSNLAIAEQLGITERTVKAHLGAVYAKTSSRNRLGLALLMQQGDAGQTNFPELQTNHPGIPFIRKR